MTPSRIICFTRPRVVADLVKSVFLRIARLTNSQTKDPQKMVTKVQWSCWRSMSHTIERRDALKTITHQIHDNWVVYSRIWSHRSLHRFYGRTQTYGHRSDVQNSRKPLHVTQTFETKIIRLDIFAQVNHINAAPTLQNLRIGFRKRRNDKSEVPVKQRGG